MSDYFGLVARPNLKLSPQKLLTLCGLNYCHFSHLDEWQQEHGLTGEAPIVGLQIDISQGSSAYWSKLRQDRQHFVSDTERRLRELERAYGEVNWQFETDDHEFHLKNLLHHKRQQYLKTGKGDWLGIGCRRRLLQILSNSKIPNCTGVLTTLYAGQTWAASHFGLRYDDVLHYWIPVYNPVLSRYSPGRLLLVKMIQSADILGLRLIDRGAGDSKAKRDLANTSHHFLRGAWSCATPGGFAARVMQGVRWRFAKN